MYNRIFTAKTFGKFKNYIKKEFDIFLANRKIKKIGYWFVDIPRTSSTSVRVSMNKSFGFPYGKKDTFEKEYSTYSPYQDHLTAQQAKELLGEKTWDKINKFTIVRNPYERLISIYFYNLITKEIHQSMSINDFVKCIEEVKYDNVNWKFLSNKKILLPAYQFLLINNKLDKKIKIINYENRLDELYKFFEGKIKKKCLSISIQSSNKIKNYISADILDNDSLKIINKIYHQDFECFGYKKLN